MSISVTSNGLTVTATVDLSVIPSAFPYGPNQGVWINWGDNTASSQPWLWGDYGMDSIGAPVPYPPGPRSSMYGTWPGGTTPQELDLFYNEAMNVNGNTATATHTYASPGDYQIFATQLDKGEQDGGDDSLYDYAHYGFLLPAAQNTVTAASGGCDPATSTISPSHMVAKVNGGSGSLAQLNSNYNLGSGYVKPIIDGTTHDVTIETVAINSAAFLTYFKNTTFVQEVANTLTNPIHGGNSYRGLYDIFVYKLTSTGQVFGYGWYAQYNIGPSGGGDDDGGDDIDNVVAVFFGVDSWTNSFANGFTMTTGGLARTGRYAGVQWDSFSGTGYNLLPVVRTDWVNFSENGPVDDTNANSASDWNYGGLHYGYNSIIYDSKQSAGATLQFNDATFCAIHSLTNDSGGGGGAGSGAARTFKSSGSVSFTEIKDFLNPEGSIGTTNVSLIGMFASAQAIPATMPNGDFVAPHNVSEFYSAEIGSSATIEITSIEETTLTTSVLTSPGACGSRPWSEAYAMYLYATNGTNINYVGSDSEAGGGAYVWAEGSGFTSSTQVINALEARAPTFTLKDDWHSVPSGSGRGTQTVSVGWSNAVVTDGKLKSVCVSNVFQYAGTEEDDQNGDGIRTFTLAVGNNGQAYFLDPLVFNSTYNPGQYYSSYADTLVGVLAPGAGFPLHMSHNGNIITLEQAFHNLRVAHSLPSSVDFALVFAYGNASYTAD